MSLVPFAPHEQRCARCDSNVVRRVGFLRKRDLCPPCLIIEAAASTLRATKVAIAAAIFTAASALIALIAYLSPNPEKVAPGRVPPPPQSLTGRAPETTVTAAPLPVPTASPEQPHGDVEGTSPVTSSSGNLAQEITPDQSAPPAHDSPPSMLPEPPTILPEPPKILPEPPTVTGIAPPSKSTIQERGPITIVIDVTPPAMRSRATPARELALPHLPDGFRSQLSGCVVLFVEVDEHGNATATVSERGGLNEFFISAAVRDVTQRWIPAVNKMGENMDDTRIVRYCWP